MGKFCPGVIAPRSATEVADELKAKAQRAYKIESFTCEKHFTGEDIDGRKYERTFFSSSKRVYMLVSTNH